jgi:2Fe-2S ferredoxin
LPTIVYHHESATPDILEVAAGITVMRAALAANIDGIIGECGGNMECATCHVYVRDAFLDSLPAISEDEEMMLDETAAPRNLARSRLGCQLVMGPELERVEVDVPGTQR